MALPSLPTISESASKINKAVIKPVAVEAASQLGVDIASEKQNPDHKKQTQNMVREMYAPEGGQFDITRISQAAAQEGINTPIHLESVRGKLNEHIPQEKRGNVEIKKPIFKNEQERDAFYDIQAWGKTQSKDQNVEKKDEPLKSSVDRTNLSDQEVILPGSKGKKGIKSRMQQRILMRSKAKAELGKNQGQG